MNRIIALFFFLISLLGAFFYSGNFFLFIAYCFLFCFLVIRSWAIKSFFMIYLSTLLFLGFWVKILASIFFSGGRLYEPVGFFDYSIPSYDEALLVSSFGAAGFISATYLLANQLKKCGFPVFLVTRDYFKLIQFRYICVWILAIGITLSLLYINYRYGVYHRGSRTNDLLSPYIQNGIKWMLVMGLDIIALSLLNIAYNFKDSKLIIFTVLALFMDFVCNVTLLSRAFPVTGAVILLSLYWIIKNQNWINRVKFFSIAILFYCILSLLSVSIVNIVRNSLFSNILFQGVSVAQSERVVNNFLPLLVGRWTGLEGVAAISAYPNKGTHLMMDALSENKVYSNPSFYDSVVIPKNTPYTNIGEKSFYAITLPGLIGFLYYADSYFVVFIGTFLLGLIGIVLELIFLWITTYPLIAAFVSYLVAYRYASFGYAPKDSYLLGLSLFGVAVIGFMMRKFRVINLFLKTS